VVATREQSVGALIGNMVSLMTFADEKFGDGEHVYYQAVRRLNLPGTRLSVSLFKGTLTLTYSEDANTVFDEVSLEDHAEVYRLIRLKREIDARILAADDVGRCWFLNDVTSPPLIQ
jgi:hypothetical protein